jgi:histidinol-phosphate aminotransferase
MPGYTPGEQPCNGGVVKLNTNESPYPPSPRVLDALRDAVTGERLRKYPDPRGRVFCATAARVLGVDPNGILIGNGSDDILTILTRACVPDAGMVVSPAPTYLLYRTLAAIQRAEYQEVPFTPSWQLARPWPMRTADLTLVANPNSPSGTAVTSAELAELAEQLHGQ